VSVNCSFLSFVCLTLSVALVIVMTDNCYVCVSVALASVATALNVVEYFTYYLFVAVEMFALAHERVGQSFFLRVRHLPVSVC